MHWRLKIVVTASVHLAGSGLSALGGAIRVGELLPTTGPIRHALKLELFAKQYYYWKVGTTTNETCWRWPAIACDGCEATLPLQPLTLSRRV